MRIDVITIFPESFTPLKTSILKRAQEKGCVKIELWDLRDFSTDKHKKVDDAPYGGGKGMVLKCEPIFRAVKEIKKVNSAAQVILTSPEGALFNDKMAESLSREKGLIFICGHYEGVDERVSELVDMEISIGDYILTGGELPAMVMIDSLARFLPGVLPESAPIYESFRDYLLDWPCYTRPAVFRGKSVPKVLLSGDHGKIARWREKKAQEKTRKKRPDLYHKYLTIFTGRKK